MKPFTLKTLAAAGCFQSVLALPNSPMQVMETVTIPSGWIKKSAAPDNQVIPLRFALKQRDMESLEARLLKTSDPDHALYGQHLSLEEVSSYLRPSHDSVTQVENWLQRNGVQVDEKTAQRSHAGDYFTFHVPVSKARSLLGGADLAVFEHSGTGNQFIRTEQYSLPSQVHDHIDYVGPLTLFAEPKAQSSGAAVKDLNANYYNQCLAYQLEPDFPGNDFDYNQCNQCAVSSQCLRKYYGTEHYLPKALDRQSVGVSGFLEQWANFDDLSLFFANQRPEAYQTHYSFGVEALNGGINNQSSPGTEANLDVQTVGGMVYPINYTFLTTGGRPPFLPDAVSAQDGNEPYEQQLTYLLGLSDGQLPKVVSTSYADDEQSVPAAYAKRVCNQIMSLGARGVTLLYGSGDNGVGTNGKCVSNGAFSQNGQPTFLPMFPSTCPYATSVGATQFFSPEVAVDASVAGFYSGGGFSDLFPMPKYQKSAVTPYIESLGDQYQGLYNQTGRAYPDLAAQGNNFIIMINGSYQPIGGTLASTPLVASMVALLNDARLAAGKSTLGFINPLIYSKLLGSDGLHQITSGSSAGCDVAGFPAQKSWSAVSGAGSPRFEKLVELIN